MIHSVLLYEKKGGAQILGRKKHCGENQNIQLILETSSAQRHYTKKNQDMLVDYHPQFLLYIILYSLFIEVYLFPLYSKDCSEGCAIIQAKAPSPFHIFQPLRMHNLNTLDKSDMILQIHVERKIQIGIF